MVVWLYPWLHSRSIDRPDLSYPEIQPLFCFLPFCVEKVVGVFVLCCCVLGVSAGQFFFSFRCSFCAFQEGGRWLNLGEEGVRVVKKGSGRGQTDINRSECVYDKTGPEPGTRYPTNIYYKPFSSSFLIKETYEKKTRKNGPTTYDHM